MTPKNIVQGKQSTKKVILSFSVNKKDFLFLNMPFGQYFLAAAIAPGVYVTSSAEDLWADPISEYLNCFAV